MHKDSCGDALARYQVDGSLDPTFGTGGLVLSGSASALVLQPDGKLVTAGSTSTGFGVTRSEGFALARYEADGRPDPTFGTGGLVLTYFSNASFAEGANALVLQPDGKLVAAGHTDSESGTFVLARYEVDGSLDPAFGTGGLVRTNLSNRSYESYEAGVSALVLQPDGKLVAAGYTSTGLGADQTDNFALARYEVDGSLDPTFGTGGLVRTHSRNVSFDRAYALILQPDSKLVAAGSAFFSVSSQADFSLVRYLGE